jgi:hypothetical protein
MTSMAALLKLMEARSKSVYLIIAINTSFLSLWWGYQLSLSLFAVFSEFRYVFPSAAIGGSLISTMLAKCTGRLNLFTICSAVGLVASALVRCR